MSEEKKKKKIDEILEHGRIYGSISKEEPELWDWVEKESVITGRKKHELISDYIARAIIEREVVARGLTMEQLLAAWDLKDRMESMLMKKTITLGSQIFTALLNQIGEMLAGIKAQQEERISKIVEEEKKRDIDFQMRKTQAQIMSTMLQTVLIPMITQLKLPGVQLPQQIQLTSDTKKSEKPKAVIIDE